MEVTRYIEMCERAFWPFLFKILGKLPDGILLARKLREGGYDACPIAGRKWHSIPENWFLVWQPYQFHDYIYEWGGDGLGEHPIKTYARAESEFALLPILCFAEDSSVFEGLSSFEEMVLALVMDVLFGRRWQDGDWQEAGGRKHIANREYQEIADEAEHILAHGANGLLRGENLGREIVLWGALVKNIGAKCAEHLEAHGADAGKRMENFLRYLEFFPDPVAAEFVLNCFVEKHKIAARYPGFRVCFELREKLERALSEKVIDRFFRREPNFAGFYYVVDDIVLLWGQGATCCLMQEARRTASYDGNRLTLHCEHQSDGYRVATEDIIDKHVALKKLNVSPRKLAKVVETVRSAGPRKAGNIVVDEHGMVVRPKIASYFVSSRISAFNKAWSKVFHECGDCIEVPDDLRERVAKKVFEHWLD